MRVVNHIYMAKKPKKNKQVHTIGLKMLNTMAGLHLLFKEGGVEGM